MVGIEGLPNCSMAGNVVHPKLKLVLSFRTPPTLDVLKAEEFVKKELLRDPPYNAKITVKAKCSGSGWNALCLSKKAMNLI